MTNRTIRPTVLSLACGAALACAAVIASPASAQSIPPGNSGADQYTEGVPGVGGNQPSSGGGGSGAKDGASSGAPLAPSTLSELEAAGPAGSQAAQVLGRSTPKSERLKRAIEAAGVTRGSASGSEEEIGSEAGADLSSAVRGAVSGSDDGMGPVLPALLLVVLAGAIGLLVWRRIGSTRPSAQG